MEAVRRVLGGDDCDVVGKRGVERVGRRSSGGPPSASRLATWPVAWTPVSVRPATASPPQRGSTASSTSRSDAFDGALTRLACPAAEIGAVVLERQLERWHSPRTRGHARPRPLARGRRDRVTTTSVPGSIVLRRAPPRPRRRASPDRAGSSVADDDCAPADERLGSDGRLCAASTTRVRRRVSTTSITAATITATTAPRRRQHGEREDQSATIVSTGAQRRWNCRCPTEVGHLAWQRGVVPAKRRLQGLPRRRRGSSRRIRLLPNSAWRIRKCIDPAATRLGLKIRRARV